MQHCRHSMTLPVGIPYEPVWVLRYALFMKRKRNLLLNEADISIYSFVIIR